MPKCLAVISAKMQTPRGGRGLWSTVKVTRVISDHCVLTCYEVDDAFLRTEFVPLHLPQQLMHGRCVMVCEMEIFSV